MSWLLVDEDDAPLARCAGIDGLFADLPPRPRERFTLVGCALTAAVWPRNVHLSAASWSGEVLCDVTVLARRPSAAVPGTVDVDLDGFVSVYDRTDAVPRPAGVTEFELHGTEPLPSAGSRSGPSATGSSR